MALIRRHQLDGPKPPQRRRPAMHDMIGRRLRLYYEEAQRHPLPVRLAVLLDILDQVSEPQSPARRR
jgi:hypothetical protein